jgi:hypothetical protein
MSISLAAGVFVCSSVAQVEQFVVRCHLVM